VQTCALPISANSGLPKSELSILKTHSKSGQQPNYGCPATSATDQGQYLQSGSATYPTNQSAARCPDAGNAIAKPTTCFIERLCHRTSARTCGGFYQPDSAQRSGSGRTAGWHFFSTTYTGTSPWLMIL